MPGVHTDRAGRPPLQTPAFTKNFSMAIAAVLAITLDPAIRLLFTHMDP